MKYNCDDGNALIEIEAATALEAAEEYVDGGDWGDRNETIVVDVWVTPLDADGDEIEDDRECITVELEPEDPEFDEGEGHEWRSPYEVLGGLKENPGVWGSQHGGVSVKEVCANCGRYKITDTGATRSDNGQRMTRVTYEDADEASLAWVESLKEEYAR